MKKTERKVIKNMKYTATLNGKKYDVELERIEEYAPVPRGGEVAPAPVAAAPAPAAPAPVAAAPVAAAPAPVAAAAGATTIESPMPGKILEIKVSAGQAVKYGQVVLTMEAMKMETEIVAPADGTVAQILVKANDAVETGTALVTLN